MFVHIFLFRWRSRAADADKARAAAAIRALKPAVPGLRDVFVGTNVSQAAQGFELGGVMTFDDRTAYDAYVVHPEHLALLDWLVPLIEPLEVDFED